MIVVIEGPPGAGKTTVAEILAAEPDVLYVPEMIAPPDLLGGPEAYRQHDIEKDMLMRSLGRNKLCVADRSWLSNLVFAVASPHERAAEARQWIEHGLNEGYLKLADHYLYFRVSPATSIARRNPSSVWWRGEQFTRRVIDFYDELFLSGTFMGRPVAVIDAECPKEEVVTEIKKVLNV